MTEPSVFTRLADCTITVQSDAVDDGDGEWIVTHDVWADNNTGAGAKLAEFYELELAEMFVEALRKKLK